MTSFQRLLSHNDCLLPRNCNWNSLPCCPATAIARGRHAVIDHLSVANALRLSVFALFAQVADEPTSPRDSANVNTLLVPVKRHRGRGGSRDTHGIRFKNTGGSRVRSRVTHGTHGHTDHTDEPHNHQRTRTTAEPTPEVPQSRPKYVPVSAASLGISMARNTIAGYNCIVW